METALKISGIDEEIVKKALEYLERRSFINDERMARDLYEKHAASKPVSRKLFLQELQERGLDITVAERTLNEWDAQRETEFAVSALKVKWGEAEDNPSPKSIRKWLSFLNGRGFDEDAAAEAVRIYCGVDIDSW